MGKATDENYQKAFKPFDIVSNERGNVGFIQEVSVNECQPEPYITYSVKWLVGSDYNAWWSHDHLKFHCNFFVKLAEEMVHPFGTNKKHVKNLFSNLDLA